MGRGSDDLQSALLRQRRDDGAQAGDVGASFLNVLADAGADLDLRLNHLRLDLLAENHLAFVEELRHVRTQLARLRIDDLKLFLNTKCELIEHTFYLSPPLRSGYYPKCD